MPSKIKKIVEDLMDMMNFLVKKIRKEVFTSNSNQIKIYNFIFFRKSPHLGPRNRFLYSQFS